MVNPAGPAPAAAPAAASAPAPAAAAAPAPAPAVATAVSAPAMPPLPRLVRAPSLVGSWQGVAPNMAASITIAPSGLFAEDEMTSGVRVLIHGRILAAGPGAITLVAENWAPAGIRLQHAVTYRETWLGPNRVVMTGNGGSITMNRVG